MDAPSVSPSDPGPGGPRQRPWARVVGVVVAVGVFATVLVLGRHTLARSLGDLGSLHFQWFALGVVFECISLAAFGLSRRDLLQADGHTAAFGSVMSITYASNALSMSVPFAGAQLAVVFSYRQFRRRGLDPALTSWALAASAIASTSALALVLVVGAFAGGAPLATVAGFAGAAVFALPAVTVGLALRYPRARAVANKVLAGLVRLVQRVGRRPLLDPGVLESFLNRLAGIRLSVLKSSEVFGLAVLNWLADCACLVCAIKAAGAPVPWSAIILVYGAGAAVGSTGITPGGFGVVEATLTGALAAAGLDTSHALTAVLAYRLVNYWMILVGGWVALIVLTRAHSQPYQQHEVAATHSGPHGPDGQSPADSP
ncbi:MAG TPA: YbhN family protein [Streptosporangiaceae bacterium]|nr:YbhN family protein [Streptosporangiaceae bacterium]